MTPREIKSTEKTILDFEELEEAPSRQGKKHKMKKRTPWTRKTKVVTRSAIKANR